MNLQIHSRATLLAAIADGNLPQHALISFRDPEQPPVPPTPGCAGRLDVYCRDVAADCTDLEPPTQHHAETIARFMCAVQSGSYGYPPVDTLLLQCETGIGRSAAVGVAMAMRLGDHEAATAIRQRGTHNRRLLELLLRELGLPPIVEPLVAMVVRVKYPPDRLAAFYWSMVRQRYRNWSCLFVTDGPWDHAWEEYGLDFGGRHFPRLIETPERRGLWGHPWRQLGIDAALALDPRPAYIGLSNDDNYYTPGYLEQMVLALQTEQAQLALCQIVHSYSGWGRCDAAPVVGMADVGNWLAAADLVASTPWPGSHFTADGEYVEALAAKAGGWVAVRKPLFVHN